ncbi:MAG: tetratricopeptide repeat protein [Spirochaetales bacterium]|nr:tetratricopeptide repeat protein [Spirochaetales bacterium]
MRQHLILMKTAKLFVVSCLVFLLGCSQTKQSTQPTEENTLQLYLAARKYYSEQRLDAALELLLENQEQAPDFIQNSFLLGKVYYFKNDFPQAENCWQQALKINPCYLDTRKWLARLFLQQDRTEEAGSILADALAVSSEDPELLILMAKVKRKQEDLAGAIELYQKSQAFTERLSEASIGLAEIYYGFGLKDRAELELKKALALLGDDSGISLSIATTLDLLEQADGREGAP